MLLPFTFWLLLLLESGDIKTNQNLSKKFSFIKFFHWNLNRLAAHDFVKMPLIEAFIAAPNFDIIWDKVFKNATSKVFGRQPLKNFTWSILEYFVPYVCRKHS